MKTEIEKPVNMSESWIGVGRSEIGRVRPTNQDAFAVLNDRRVWIVADGMGGHPAGDVAANTAVDAVIHRSSQPFAFADHLSRAPELTMSQLLLAANQAIHDRSATQPWTKGMGTTVVLMAISSIPAQTAHIAHVGDSRAYLFRTETLTQLTRDHTVVEDYLRNGLIDASAARTHPERHVLTKALGMETTIQPEYTSIPLNSDDVLLLCSDGLTKMVDNHAIAAILSRNGRDAARASAGLVERALAHGGEDNVTVIVCTAGPHSARNGH